MAEAKLAVVNEKALEVVHYPEFSTEQIRLLGETVAKGCDQNELAFFLNVCKMKRLDPFSQQVHVVKRWDSDLGREKMTIQIGIDGFRVIAARTGELAGNDEPIYDTEEGPHPNKATVTVYRWSQGKGLGERIPYTASARFSEYVQTKKDGTPNRMWATKPFIMLGKCAEALALRKAFPDEYSGLYSDEEMEQADNETHAPQGKPPVQQPQRASDKGKTPPPPAAQKTESKPQAEQTASGNASNLPAGQEIISGVIKSSADKNGILRLDVDDKIVLVKEAEIDGDMRPGYFIKLRGEKQHSDKVGTFYVLRGLIELAKEGEVLPADNKKMDPENAALADELFGEKPKEGTAAVQEMIDKGQVTTAANLPQDSGKKPGTIGKKRAIRLDALCNSHKDKNNGFNHDEMKRILSAMPVPVEHLADMETGMYEEFEAWATGAKDWREFWKD